MNIIPSVITNFIKSFKFNSAKSRTDELVEIIKECADSVVEVTPEVNNSPDVRQLKFLDLKPGEIDLLVGNLDFAAFRYKMACMTPGSELSKSDYIAEQTTENLINLIFSYWKSLNLEYSYTDITETLKSNIINFELKIIDEIHINNDGTKSRYLLSISLTINEREFQLSDSRFVDLLGRILDADDEE